MLASGKITALELEKTMEKIESWGAVSSGSSGVSAYTPTSGVKSAPPNKQYTICAAKHGGFYVIEPTFSTGAQIEVAFAASTMEDCFDWIKNKWLIAPDV